MDADNRPQMEYKPEHPNPLNRWQQILEGIFLRIAEDLDSLPTIAQTLQSIDDKLGQLVPPKALSATLVIKPNKEK